MPVDTYTTGKLGLIEPARGSYVDMWDTPLFANWQTLEAAVSGTTTINVSNSNIVLTVPSYPTYANPPAESNSTQNLRLLLQGTLTTNITVFIPSTVGGFWIVDNNSTGAFTITIKTTATGSTGIAARQGYASILYSNGTNISYADMGSIRDGIDLFVPSSVPVGAIVPFAGSTVPNANWLACNGAAVSRSTYSGLFTYLGTLYGTGDGSTTFNLPNLNQGSFIRGIGGNAAAQGTQQLSAVGPLTVTDPGHSHTPLGNRGFIAAQPGAGVQYSGAGAGPIIEISTTSTASTGITVVGTSSAVETRPINYAMLYCIRAL